MSDEFDEWCTDCKEYDHEKHNCPRFNRVIREALEEAQEERIQAIKDCRNCKHGKYNDYHETYLCYNDRYCVDWGLWEPKETQSENKIGKWVWKMKNGIADWKCSLCGGGSGRSDFPFCPWCGKEMEHK